MKLKTLFTAILMMSFSVIWAQDNSVETTASTSKTEKMTKAEKKAKKKLEKEQKKQAIHMQKVTDAQANVIKCENKLAEEKIKYDKMQSELELDKQQGELTHLKLAEREIQVSDQKLKVQDKEEELKKAKSKLSELQ